MNEPALSSGADRAFWTFRTDGRLYGIDVSYVREVSTQSVVTRVAQASPIIRGLTNLRSRIYLVLDFRAAIGLASADATPDSRLVVLQPTVAENLAMLVDCGGEIVSVPPEQIEQAVRAAADPADLALRERSSPVVGVCKLAHELMLVVDPARLVAASEQVLR